MRKIVTLAVAAVAFTGIGAFASSDNAEAFGWCGASYYRTAACGFSYYRSGVYYSRGIYRRAAVRRYVSYRRSGMRGRRR